jgi:RimJ/RimL family protein N-acetyltransferase
MLCLRADVSLTPLGFEHAERMCAWMQDPQVREGIGLRSEPSMERTRSWLTHALEDDGTRAFAVLMGNSHVGNVILDRRDNVLQTARLSVYIGEPGARGRGVGSTAVFRAARFGFSTWGLHKIWLIAHMENSVALATYERVGFRREGLLRDEFLLGGRRIAAAYMGLLAADFARIEDEAREICVNAEGIS